MLARDRPSSQEEDSQRSVLPSLSFALLPFIKVVSMMNWIHEEPFVVSVNFQDGSVGTSHPWSDNFTEVWRRSDLFRSLHWAGRVIYYSGSLGQSVIAILPQ